MNSKRRYHRWTVGDLLAGLAGFIGDIVGGLFDDNGWW